MSGRYEVQEKFPPVGVEGQKLLKGSNVVLVGVGGLGCFLAQYLVRAGVGRFRFVDFDVVELSNLQRQVLYDEGDVGKSKVECAHQHLRRINSEVNLEPLEEKLTPQNAERLLTGFDVILDGTDNFKARFIMNDVAKKNHIPFAFGSVAGAYGMSKIFLPDERVCLRDVVGDSLDVSNAPTAATGGLISPILGVVTAFMATETIKVLTGALDRVERRLMVFDLWQSQWSQLEIAENPQCPVCSGKRYPALEGKSK